MPRSWNRVLLTLAIIGCVGVCSSSTVLAGKGKPKPPPEPPPPPPVVYSLTVLNGVGNLGPAGLNDHGDVVGDVGPSATRVAVIWPAGSTDPIDLNTFVDPTFDVSLHAAYAINNTGQIAGFKTGGIAPYGSGLAFRLTFPESGAPVFENIEGVGGARDINEAGDVVTSLFYTHVYTDETGSFELENTLIPGGQVHGRAVNNFGEVVGGLVATNNGLYHAFLYSIGSGQLEDLTPFSNGSTAMDINDQGEVVGNNKFGQRVEPRASYWTRQTGMVDLGTLGGTNSIAFGINEDGLIVGESTAYKPGRNDPPAPFVAFLYVNGAMHRLLAEVANGGLIANGQLPDGWGQLTSRAVKINNAGQICGWVQYPDLTRQGYVLTPTAP